MKLITALPLIVFATFGCESKAPLDTKVQDLQSARVEAQKESEGIRADLEDARKELARLKLKLDQVDHATPPDVLGKEAKVAKRSQP